MLATRRPSRRRSAIVAGLGAGQVVLSHVEEMDSISYDDLLRVEQRLQAEGSDIRSPGTA